MSLADGFDAEGDASFLLYFTRDRDEGLKAFPEEAYRQIVNSLR